MMDFNKKIYISLCFFTATALVFVFFLIHPLLNQIRENSYSFVLQKNSFAELQERETNFKKLKNLWRLYEQDLKKIDALFINSSDPVEFTAFMEFLENNAGNCGLSIEILSLPTKKAEPDSWNFNNYQLSLKGSFSNVLKFLEKIENAPYLIEVSNLNIKKDSTDLNKNTQTNLTIKAYIK
ncbi:MAG: type 4a pilus biogenesis protein PilO [Minisyncoccales bacterium]